MGLDEEAGGSLHELGAVYEEDGGSLHEVRVYEEQGGSLHLVHEPGFDGVIFPFADVGSDNFDDSDGDGDNWDELDEWPHDGTTTEVTATLATESSESFRVDLEDPLTKDDADRIATNGLIQVRFAARGGDIGTVDLDVELLEVTTVRASWSVSGTNLETSYKEFTLTLSQSVKDSIFDWSDLVLRFIFSNTNDLVEGSGGVTAANVLFDPNG